MKTTRNARPRPMLAGAILLSTVVGALLLVWASPSIARAQLPGGAKSTDAAEAMAALRAELQEARAKLPDQSHAMADVGYHFANLWFAGTKRNWPLAKFYLDETRSHLKWAVRIIPVRKDPAGRDLRLADILDAVDGTLLSRVAKSIEAKDADGFAAAYRDSLEGCYSCHKAAGKPYLRPQIPAVPPQPIVNFDPEATWPR